jgi:hypothetical protein
MNLPDPPTTNIHPTNDSDLDMPIQNIDKLTLSIMCNKKQYNKYLSKTDTKKYEEYREHNRKLKKYSHKIIDITNEYLCSQDKQVTNELDEAFQNYAKSCIKYLEMKEFENRRTKGSYEKDEDDDEVLFGSMDAEDGEYGQSEYIDELEKTDMRRGKSYWGVPIHKIGKVAPS